MEHIHFIDCLYPDWEGGLIRENHTIKSFDKDGFCKVCGMTIEQASRGKIKSIEEVNADQKHSIN